MRDSIFINCTAYQFVSFNNPVHSRQQTASDFN
jgi:hypothetical protein